MNKYNAYSQEKSFDTYDLDDKINLAKSLAENVNKKEKVIEGNPDILKDIIDMDLRENIPPQIYEVISCIVDVIVKAEDA